MGYPEKIKEDTIVPPLKKRATVNCPSNCDYFDCAIADEYFNKCACYKDGQLDCVNTYREYYKLKEFKMVWNRGKDKSPEWYTK